MSFLDYYNRQVAIMDVFYESHADLIEKLCFEFGQPEKAGELKEKFLDKQLKLKAKKDPKRPKKPQSSYLLFSNSYREQNKTSLAGVPIMEVSKRIGQEWQKLTADQRKVYEELAAEDKEKYKVAYDNYQQSLFTPLLNGISTNVP
jgi:hypothetical protein